MSREGAGSGLGRLWHIGFMSRLDKLEERIANGTADKAALRAVAAEKVQQGANLTRAEASAFLEVSTKKLQRMETAGQLRRCPGLDGVVRYAARDVRRLASANGKEA
jgi:hypothetical protein